MYICIAFQLVNKCRDLLFQLSFLSWKLIQIFLFHFTFFCSCPSIIFLLDCRWRCGMVPFLRCMVHPTKNRVVRILMPVDTTVGTNRKISNSGRSTYGTHFIYLSRRLHIHTWRGLGLFRLFLLLLYNHDHHWTRWYCSWWVVYFLYSTIYIFHWCSLLCTICSFFSHNWRRSTRKKICTV